MKDQVFLASQKIFNRIDQQVKNTKASIEIKKEAAIAAKAETPGALRVVNGLLNRDTKLSKDNIITLTNKYRISENLSTLAESSLLDISAQKKVQDMFNRQYFEHISPQGVGVSGLSEEAGYQYILIGENLALGNFKDDLALVDAWMASPGHRANILNKHYTEIGIAVGQGQFDGKNIWLAVQHFGTPRSICQSVDSVLLATIDLNQNKIKSLESDLDFRRKIIDGGAFYKDLTNSQQIDEYNNLVKIYNILIKETKIKIDQYNLQIKDLNQCIEDNQ